MLGGTARSAGLRDAGDSRDRAEVEHATEAAWWARRWYGWADWRLSPGIAVLAAFAVGLDVVTAWTDVSLGHLGRIPVSPALPFAFVLAGLIGLPALGASRARWRRWREFGVLGTGALAACVLGSTLGGSGLADAAGIVLTALGEELVYRLAALVVVGAVVAAIVGRDWRTPAQWGTGPGVAALVVGALLFSVLPGHVAQMAGPATIVPFASLALVLGWVVLRTGALWPAVIAHAVLDLLTIGVLLGGIGSGLRIGLAGATLLGLVVAADVAGRRSGQLRPVPSVIDLTTGSPGATAGSSEPTTVST